MTPAQQRAIDVHLPTYGLEYSESKLDPTAVFGRDAPLWVEIGFGNGDALASMAQRFPERNFLGIEVHAPGVGSLLQTIHSLSLTNVRVLRHDAQEVVECMLESNSVERVLVFFPDPWPKKRHHKRRILQSGFISSIENVLLPAGVLHCATDWEEYAESVLELLSSRAALSNIDAGNGYAERPDYRAATRFEERGKRLGHRVYDLMFQKNIR